jgi:hypothetical protein
MPKLDKGAQDILDLTAAQLGILPAGEFAAPLPIRGLRRGRARAFEDDMGVITLEDDEGVLRWHDEPVLPAAGYSGRRGPGARTLAVGPSREYRFEKLAGNQVASFLDGVDLRLTPYSGLRGFSPDSGKLVPLAKVPEVKAGERMLLFVHGTFSSCDCMFSEEFLPLGAAWLATAGYKHVLTFDHPTLSRSPMLNACELSRLFQNVRTQVDVIAHSRGGLVTRWWLEALGGAEQGERRAVLVGSPVAGTSLASPFRLKAAMSLLTNFGAALRAAGGLASAWLPLLSVPLAVLKVMGSLSSAVSKTPVFDAAVALIPGLSGQSAVQNNFEIRWLRTSVPACLPRYFAITANFEPTDPGWKFWQYFRRDQLLDRAAEWVFDGANDLVVDTGSMLSLFDDEAAPRPECVQAWEKSTTVHHCNYFRQTETVRAIARALGT